VAPFSSPCAAASSARGWTSRTEPAAPWSSRASPSRRCEQLPSTLTDLPLRGYWFSVNEENSKTPNHIVSANRLFGGQLSWAPALKRRSPLRGFRGVKLAPVI
jgi:hypothetical protein